MERDGWGKLENIVRPGQLQTPHWPNPLLPITDGDWKPVRIIGWIKCWCEFCYLNLNWVSTWICGWYLSPAWIWIIIWIYFSVDLNWYLRPPSHQLEDYPNSVAPTHCRLSELYKTMQILFKTVQHGVKLYWTACIFVHLTSADA